MHQTRHQRRIDESGRRRFATSASGTRTIAPGFLAHQRKAPRRPELPSRRPRPSGSPAAGPGPVGAPALDVAEDHHPRLHPSLAGERLCHRHSRVFRASLV